MEFNTDGNTIVIRHEAISNYMDAMTMPFKVKETNELAGLRIGDEISFRLEVTGTESWIDRITKIGTASFNKSEQQAHRRAAEGQPTPSGPPLLDCKFTNELGQAVSLGDFHGQALAITFFFTRCPLPDYCPRLSKNFQEASQKLISMRGGPTNWHFLSISFDTEFDTPRVLKAYGNMYQYDPARWSFLTGPPDRIRELARLADVTFERQDGGLFTHNFRTLIIDAAGHLQMTFPMGGNLSDVIVVEILKAAAVTNGFVAQDMNNSRSQATKAAPGQSAESAAR